MISLRNRMILICSLFICLSALLLSLSANYFAENLFSGFVKKNIQSQSEKIVESIAAQYAPESGGFSTHATLTLGMGYVHQGYIISIEDNEGNVVWDARACDMQECASVIREIESRMKGKPRLNGQLQVETYPLIYQSALVGRIHIETFGPFFYSESEAEFLGALNRLLALIAGMFALLSVGLSVLLATALSRPILKAASTAKEIAGGNLRIRIPERHRTKELDALSRSVNELAAALEDGERWQKQLTSDIAHELRTPLTTLQGNLEAMIDGVWAPTPERLSSCHEEIVRLSTLVEDLGLLSILEQEGFALRKTHFDLSALISAVLEQYSPAAEQKGIRISYAPKPLPYYGDYDRLKQVFVNLVSNAVKYTDQGRIEIQAVSTEDTYQVKVSDTGIGIPECDLPHIFERFYRSDKSRNRGTGGTGIGLAVAFTIAAAHDGEIRASSESGKGSEFILELPKLY